VAGTLPALTAIWREEELLGYGYEFLRVQSHEGHCWTERVQVIRSLGQVPAAIEAIDRHVKRAQEALYQLTPAPKQGVKQIKEEQELHKAIDTIMKKHELQGVLTVTWHYEDMPKNNAERRCVISSVEVDEEKLRALKQQTGWRIFVNNMPCSRLPLDAGVLLYRKGAGQGIERMNSILKGAPLGISPLFVRNDDQIVGLAYLLTLALRVMSYLEISVRDGLEKTADEVPDYVPGGKSSSKPTAKKMLERIAKYGVTLNEVRFRDGTSEFCLSKLPPILIKYWKY
jgi:transposase